MSVFSTQRLAHSIARNTLFGVVAKLAQVSTRLVTIPIVIAHFGLGGYGVWSLIMTAAAYMRFGSVGIKSAFQKYVAEATGTGDYTEANRLLSTGCLLTMAFSCALLIPVALFSGALARVAGVPPEFLGAAANSMSVLAVILLLSNGGAAFEAIVMGGHRVDLARHFTTLFTILEAVAIVLLLKLGFGLFAMACVMAVSEVGFVVCCAVAARRVVPEIRIRREFVTARVVPELFRFAGSYQMVNFLEILYVSILPITLLRTFGAESAGIYAVANRFVSSVLMVPDALLIPVLSGGTMVYASGKMEDMQRVISKAFKVTLGLSLFPLAFLSLFGAGVVTAWTGQVNPAFPRVLPLVALSGLFYALSLLQLVLYRISGRASMDNIRQALRILVLFSLSVFAPRLGFYGVLGGLAMAELAGMLFMLFALTRVFKGFRARYLLDDTCRLMVATAFALTAGIAAARLPLPAIPGLRLAALVQLSVVTLACLAAGGPAVWMTKLLSAAEEQAVRNALLPRRRLATAGAGTQH